MISHASAELLSAYLDRQLVEPKARELEEHLDRCQQCHVRLEGLRKVVKNLHGLEQLATPLTLEQTVARRIALADEPKSLLDRFEHGMSIFNRQSPILAMFGVVIALTLFIYLFSYTLHLRENSSVQVIWEDPPYAAEGSRLAAAGRQLMWSERAGGLWLEEGADVVAVDRTLVADSEEGRAFFAEHPDLADLADLDRDVVFQVGGETVRLQ